MAQEELKKTIVEFAKTYEYSNLITIDGSGFPKGRMMENLPFVRTLYSGLQPVPSQIRLQRLKITQKQVFFSTDQKTMPVSLFLETRKS